MSNEPMDREDEIERLVEDIAASVNRWWNGQAAGGPSLRDHLRDAMNGGDLDNLGIYRRTDLSGRVLVPIHPVELSFMRRFDPDRDRSANRRELVEVIEHWQEELTDALGPAPAHVEPQPWLCRVILGMEHIDAPCSGLHPAPMLGTSLSKAGLKYHTVARVGGPGFTPVLDSTCQICGRAVARQNAQAMRWVHVGIQDGELDHGAIPRWDRERA